MNITQGSIKVKHMFEYGEHDGPGGLPWVHGSGRKMLYGVVADRIPSMIERGTLKEGGACLPFEP